MSSPVPEPGHTVLQVPVPPLEAFVRGRHAHYDPAYVSSDPAFTHAHITALGPFLDPVELGDEERALVAKIAAATEPFAFTLERIESFANGIIHLRPEPDRPFRELTARLVEAFPGCPPYAGRYAEVVPHLTLDLRTESVTEATTRAALGDVLPVTCRAERLDLAWYAPHGCRLLEAWPLG